MLSVSLGLKTNNLNMQLQLKPGQKSKMNFATHFSPFMIMPETKISCETKEAFIFCVFDSEQNILTCYSYKKKQSIVHIRRILQVQLDPYNTPYKTQKKPP